MSSGGGVITQIGVLLTAMLSVSTSAAGAAPFSVLDLDQDGYTGPEEFAAFENQRRIARSRAHRSCRHLRDIPDFQEIDIDRNGLIEEQGVLRFIERRRVHRHRRGWLWPGDSGI